MKIEKERDCWQSIEVVDRYWVVYGLFLRNTLTVEPVYNTHQRIICGHGEVSNKGI